MGAIFEWISGHNLGGLDFVEFCVAVNIAQVSWDKFQQIVRTAETRYVQISDAAKNNAREADERALVKTFVSCADWVRMKMGILWGANYCLSCLSVFVGVGMLYLNATCPWDFLLLVPSLLYLFLTYLLLGVLKIFVRCADLLVDKIRAQKDAEKLLDSIPAALKSSQPIDEAESP